MKDLDLIDRKETFKVGPTMKQRILDVLKMDADFFAENSIIDYSLLVGIHNRSEHPSTFLSRRHSDDSEVELDDIQSVTNDDKSPLMTLNAWDRQSTMSVYANNKQFYEVYEGGLLSHDKQHIYYMGVIDIFTQYNARKKLEHVYRSMVEDRHTVSCVPPRYYADRFFEFLGRAFV